MWVKMHMKVLLVAVNAKYIHSNLAVYSLKAYAEKYGQEFNKPGNEIELAEYTINQYSEWILRDLYMRKPDVIGFSCYIWNISMIEEILENLYKILPDTKVWLGGPEVSYNAESVLSKHKSVKGIMRGEGEETLKCVLDAYARAEEDSEKSRNEEWDVDRYLLETNGITFRYKEKIIENKPQKPVDMSDIPFVYENLNNFENRIIYYESSRGCPFSCSYCLSSIDKTLRFRNIDIVKKELKYFIDKKTAQVKFVDRTFNCKKDHAMEIWKFIKDNDNGITNFHFEIAADIMTDEEMDIIKTMRPGLIQLEIGVQSTNTDTIRLINRKMDFDKVALIVNKLKKPENVHLHLDLIAGLPREDIASFKKSFNMVYGLKPEQLQLGFLKVLHGSAMELQIEENDIKYNSRPPYEVFSTKWISFGDILRLKNVEEVLEIYYNSGQFTASIVELEKYFNNPFEMYEMLGEFYQKFSAGGVKHSRIQRYNLLLGFYRNFVIEKGKAGQRELEIFIQLLTLDVYLRENIKSRPDFAGKLDLYKKKIIEIYVKEEEERRLLPEYEQYNSKQMANMTHLEVFDFNIEKYIKTGVDDRMETYIIFDYKNRNPLNHDANIIIQNGEE